MTTRTFALLFAVLVTSCASAKLGPFADEPREQPTAPEPTWGGVGQPIDAGASDAQAPAQRSK